MTWPSCCIACREPYWALELVDSTVAEEPPSEDVADSSDVAAAASFELVAESALDFDLESFSFSEVPRTLLITEVGVKDDVMLSRSWSCIFWSRPVIVQLKRTTPFSFVVLVQTNVMMVLTSPFGCRSPNSADCWYLPFSST